MKAALHHIDNVGPNTITFWFKPSQPLRYSAGQFIELTVPHYRHDDRGEKRWFTLSSSPTEQLVSITTKYSLSPSSFKSALWALNQSDIVDISQPMGDFILPMQKSIPVLFVVAGIGVTPVRSILQSLSNRNNTRNIEVLYVASTEEHHLFKQLITSVASQSKFFISDEMPVALLTEQIIHSYQGNKGLQIYISGPELFVEDLQARLGVEGIPMSCVVTDFFHGYDSE